VLSPLLDDEQRTLVADERRVLGETQDAIVRAGSPDEDVAALRASADQLDHLFLLVVVGEFNAGKSALVNALLGQRLLEEGVTPTTSRVGLVVWGDAPSRAVLESGLERRTAPLPLLRDLTIVDTPGTNAVLRQHEVLTRDFVPRSDLVLFVTSADRPFAESERAFLEAVREWGKKVVVVLNKADVLVRDADREEVLGFVGEQSRALLGRGPEVFPVSARNAFVAREAGDETAFAASGLAALESYLATTLDEKERLRLKLGNPLGVAARVLARARDAVRVKLGLLADDVAGVLEIERELELYREDLGRDFRLRLADVDNRLHAFEDRGEAFFEETLRVGRVLDLLNRERVRGEFERRVVADLPREIEAKVAEIADWTAGAELRQWKTLLERVLRRQAAHERMPGGLGAPEESRERLLDRVRHEAQRAVLGYDHAAEARRLAQAARDAVAGAALLQIGALGVGAAVAVLATTTFGDVTGFLTAGTLSVMGLLVLPAKRRHARRELRQKVSALRERLMGTLTAVFDAELGRSVASLREAVAPYTRSVRAERDRIGGLADELERLDREIVRLRDRVTPPGA
jgi:GTP-binding protein EngB required for normal cell division